MVRVLRWVSPGSRGARLWVTLLIGLLSPITSTAQSYRIVALGARANDQGFADFGLQELRPRMSVNTRGEIAGMGSPAFLYLPRPAYGLPAGLNFLDVLFSPFALNDNGEMAGVMNRLGGPKAARWRSGVITHAVSSWFAMSRPTGRRHFENVPEASC